MNIFLNNVISYLIMLYLLYYGLRRQGEVKYLATAARVT